MFKEDEKTELKKSLASLNEIVETAVAFANKKGGKILIGIDDSGKVVGIKVGKGTIEKISNKIISETIPPIYPEIEVKRVDHKNIIEIKILESKAKPHFFKGIAYIRVGKSNHRLSPQELEDFFKDKLSRIISFDALSSESSLEEIDENKVKDFFRTMIEARGRKIRYKNLKSALTKLGLYKDGKVLNAAVIAFGKDPYLQFPQLAFRCIYKPSIAEVEDYAFITGDLFSMVENVLNFIKKHIRKRVQIKGMKRIEQYVPPIEVFREALFNSLIHRDYFVHSGNYLTITDEEIIIKNPGIMPKGLTIQDLYTEHESIPRNPILASLAYLRGDIEEWGSGTLRIIEGCKKFNLRIPKFEVKRGFFIVRIYLKKEEFGKDEKRILELLKHRQLSPKEISKELNLKYRRVRYLLQKFAKIGLVRSKGYGKTRKYFI